MKNIFFGSNIYNTIKNKMEKAKKRCIFCTPYIDIQDFNDFTSLIDKISKKDIDIIFYIRDEQADNYNKTSKTINYLINKQIKVVLVKNLHAKCYIADNTIIITSYNITPYSTNNTLDLGSIIKSKKITNIIINEIESHSNREIEIESYCKCCKTPLIYNINQKKEEYEYCFNCYIKYPKRKINKE